MRRRSRAAALIAALAVTAGCGRTLTVYEKTSPRRVDVAKQTGEPVLIATATRSDAGIELRLKNARSVRLSRVLQYNASAVIYDHGGNPAVELLETLTGLLILAVPTAFWDLGAQIDGPDTPARKVVRERSLFLALLDPTRSVFTNNIRTDPVAAEAVFADRPEIREYDVSLPAAAIEVSYRGLDEAGREVGRGSASTDLHGSALVFEGIPETAIAMELRAAGQTVVVPIERGPGPVLLAGADGRGLEEVDTGDGDGDGDGEGDGDGDAGDGDGLAQPYPLPEPPEPVVAFEAPPDDPAGLAAREAERRPDAELEQSWGPVPPEPRWLPRVSATLDLVPIFGSETEGVTFGQIIAEVRLLPKLSASLILGFGNVELENVIAFGTQLGGQARFYAYGDFRSGFHLGVEALRTSFEEGALTDPRVELGPMIGYKHAFRAGFTAEIQAGAQFRAAGDELVDQDYIPLVNLSIGWSF